MSPAAEYLDAVQQASHLLKAGELFLCWFLASAATALAVWVIGRTREARA